MPIITAQQLTKEFRLARKAPGTVGALKQLFRPRYEQKVAVAGIDLAIEAGESVDYVGANGAGKSTTIKLLTGILHPTAGVVSVNGLDPFRQRIANARNIGVVFGQRTQLWWDLPVQDSQRLLGDIYRVPTATFRRTWSECVELLDLQPLLNKPARQLSLGQRMRCDLAAALLHAPPSSFWMSRPSGYRMLLRPLSPFFQVTTYSLVSTYGLSNAVVGGVLLWRAAHELHLMGNVPALLLLLITVASASLMYILLGFLTNLDVFWNPSPQSSVPSLVHELLEFTKFPLSIYQRSLQFLLTWLFPFALVSYYPSLVLLGKAEAQWWLAFSAPLAALGMGLLSGWVWRQGLTRYQGVG